MIITHKKHLKGDYDMSTKKLLKILFAFVTSIIIFYCFGLTIKYWINTQLEEPLILFMGEAGSAFSKYFNLIQNIISYPFYFLCCALYGFLAKKYYSTVCVNTYKSIYAILSFVCGLLSGLLSLFISYFIAIILEFCIYGFLNIDSTLRVTWLIHPLIVISVSVFIGILTFTILIEKVVKNKYKK